MLLARGMLVLAVVAWSWTWSTAGMANPAPQGGPPRELQARRLLIKGSLIEAEGAVRLSWGTCQITAHALRVKLEEGTAFFEHICLSNRRAWIIAQRLAYLGHGSLSAHWIRLSLCSCPNTVPLLTLGAKKAWINQDGKRLHLLWPSIRIARRTVATVPYLALPLAPGVSGLTFPVIGWSGRDGLRLEEGLYLAPTADGDLLFAAGWIQHRGALGKARGRLWGERRGELQLELLGLRDKDRWRGTLQGRALIRGTGWAAGARPDLLSDRTVLADLSTEPDRRTAPYVSSRVWAWAGQEALQLSIQGNLYQDLFSPAQRDQAFYTMTRASLRILPREIVEPLVLQGGLELYHWPGAGTLARTPRLDGRQLQIHLPATRVSLDPSLSLATSWGPFQCSAGAAYHHLSFWSRDDPFSTYKREATQEILFQGELALPLMRLYRAASLRPLSHRLTPYVAVRYQEVEGQEQLVLPDGDSSLPGLTARLGLSSALVHRWNQGPLQRLLHGDLYGDLRWSTSPDADPLVTLGGEVMLGNENRHLLQLHWQWLPEENRLATLRSKGCVAVGSIQLCSGYTRVRLQHLDQLIPPAIGPWGALWWVGSQQLPLSAEIVFGSLKAALGPVQGGVVLAGDPQQGKINQGQYWLAWTWGCGCYRLVFAGQHWPGQRWPDLTARFSLLSDGQLGCGAGKGSW